MKLSFALCWILLLLLVGCTSEEKPQIIVRLLIDGTERIYQNPEPITVDQFLREIGVELS